MNYYAFIVDTDSYSGNFEREMTAYATGVLGSCCVGDSHAELFYEDNPDMDLSFAMYQKPDDADNPCCRPCAIEPTPNRGNDGYGNHADINRGSKRKDKKYYYPAYESVGMYFLYDPCEYMDMLMERSLDYAKSNKIKISGFRLQHITVTKVVNELEIESLECL